MDQFVPHPYQQDCIDAVIEKPSVALWLEMGLGKTVITLTAIKQLEYDACTISKALIIAPKKVSEATWQDEVEKWLHLRGLRISTVLGTAQQRRQALATDADIYITNRDNVAWLVETLGRGWPFDMVVLDEATSFKHHNTQRFKALRRVRPRIHKDSTIVPQSLGGSDYVGMPMNVYLSNNKTLGTTAITAGVPTFTADT